MKKTLVVLLTGSFLLGGLGYTIAMENPFIKGNNIKINMAPAVNDAAQGNGSTSANSSPRLPGGNPPLNSRAGLLNGGPGDSSGPGTSSGNGAAYVPDSGPDAMKGRPLEEKSMVMMAPENPMEPPAQSNPGDKGPGEMGPLMAGQERTGSQMGSRANNKPGSTEQTPEGMPVNDLDGPGR